MQPTVVVYGNCQARAVGIALAPRLEAAGYAVRFARSYRADDESGPAPTPEDLRNCAVLFEQVDAAAFPARDALPARCRTIRFPSIDTIVLWPFSAINRYGARTEGDRFHYGDRILMRMIEKDWDADRIVAHYLDRYDTYRLDMARVEEIERARVRRRDANADVHVGDLTEDIAAVPLFLNTNHPRTEVMRRLTQRIADAGAGHLSALRDHRVTDADLREYERMTEASMVPIHPGVAADLGLTWYDPSEPYRHFDGTWIAHDEYVRRYVASGIRVRARQGERGTAGDADRVPWTMALEGPVEPAGPAYGIYPDGFAAPLLTFAIEATATVDRLCLAAYYPPQHAAPGTMTLRSGAASTGTTVDPGTRFELVLPLRLVAGERAHVVLTTSETINMLERGQSEDNRDLGVLILAVRAA